MTTVTFDHCGLIKKQKKLKKNFNKQELQAQCIVT